MEMTARGRRILTPVVILAFVNFAAFFIVAISIGGDAVNGSVDNGSYFLADHGRITEVSWGVYWYSYVHALSIWFTHGAVVVAVLYLLITGDDLSL